MFSKTFFENNFAKQFPIVYKNKILVEYLNTKNNFLDLFLAKRLYIYIYNTMNFSKYSPFFLVVA